MEILYLCKFFEEKFDISFLITPLFSIKERKEEEEVMME